MMRTFAPILGDGNTQTVLSYGSQVVVARKVMRMEWPLTACAGDAVIVPQETSPGVRFVVHGRHGPQFACRSYAEAETRALSYAEHARARVWYADARGLQLAGSFVRRPLSSSAIAQATSDDRAVRDPS